MIYPVHSNVPLLAVIHHKY